MKIAYCWTEGKFLVILEDGRWTSAIFHSPTGQEAEKNPEKVALRLGRELLSKPKSHTKGIIASTDDSTFEQVFAKMPFVEG
jgi:hypothetical protein